MPPGMAALTFWLLGQLLDAANCRRDLGYLLGLHRRRDHRRRTGNALGRLAAPTTRRASEPGLGGHEDFADVPMRALVFIERHPLMLPLRSLQDFQQFTEFVQPGLVLRRRLPHPLVARLHPLVRLP
jgi:hypothetical protein